MQKLKQLVKFDVLIGESSKKKFKTILSNLIYEYFE